MRPSLSLLVLVSGCTFEPTWLEYERSFAANQAVRVERAGEGVVVGGRIANDAGGSDLWLTALRDDGETLWERRYPQPGVSAAPELRALVPMGEDGWLLAGPSGPGSWVTRIGADGRARWEHAIGASGAYAADGALLSDGRVALAGHVGLNHLWFAFVDGDEVSETTIEDGGPSKPGHAVAALPGGAFVIAGSISPEGVAHPYAVEVDAGGTVLQPPLFTREQAGELHAATTTPDGRVVFAGATGNRAWLLVLRNGEVAVDAQYCAGGDSSLATAATAVAALDDGGYAISGWWDWTARQLWVLRVDGSGAAVAGRRFGALVEGLVSRQGLVQTPAGGIALATTRCVGDAACETASGVAVVEHTDAETGSSYGEPETVWSCP